MDASTLLVGIALLVVVVAYVARPFRPAARAPDPAKAIEFWVARVRDAEETAPAPIEAPVSPDRGRPDNYCRECGHLVGTDDKFCSRCGTRLGGGAG